MDADAETGSHHSSAAAFVEGGVQDACDDACSICLEEFCESDPSTVTTCKHEFHLQCILEWCQRSSQCPMCWQPISLKDPMSQELLEAVEQERSIRSKRSRNTTIYRHSTLEDFELRHLHIDLDNAAFEERILQHLAAAAAMGRVRRFARREGQQGSSGTPAFSSTNPAVSLATAGEEPSSQALHISADQAEQVAVLPSENIVTAANSPAISHGWSSTDQPAPVDQDRAGPSDLHSFSETLKSRLNAVSMRYKESFTRSTQGWKEKLFSRSTSIADIGSDVRREVDNGIATVSRMIERLDMRESTRATSVSAPLNMRSRSLNEPNNENTTERHTNTPPDDGNTSTSSAGNSNIV